MKEAGPARFHRGPGQSDTPMTRKFFTSHAQSIGEYAIMVALVMAAILAMQVYVQRVLQSRYRAASQYLTNQIGAPSQYEPYYAQSDFMVSQQANASENLFLGGSVERLTNETTQRQGTQSVLPGCSSGGSCNGSVGDIPTCILDYGDCSAPGSVCCSPSPAHCSGTKSGRIICCPGFCD
jgi:Flp pilus assembly pilin Flp